MAMTGMKLMVVCKTGAIIGIMTCRSQLKSAVQNGHQFFYQENKESILSFIERTKNGIGLKLSKNAKIELSSNDNKIYEFQTFNNEFYKVLAPGVYTFKIYSEGSMKEIVVDTTSSNEYRDYISIID